MAELVQSVQPPDFVTVTTVDQSHPEHVGDVVVDYAPQEPLSPHGHGLGSDSDEPGSPGGTNRPKNYRTYTKAYKLSILKHLKEFIEGHQTFPDDVHAGSICQRAWVEAHGEKDIIMDVERLHQFLRNEKKKFHRVRKEIDEGRVTSQSKPYTYELFKYLEVILRYRLVPTKVISPFTPVDVVREQTLDLSTPAAKRLKLESSSLPPGIADTHAAAVSTLDAEMESAIAAERTRHLQEMTEMKRKYDIDRMMLDTRLHQMVDALKRDAQAELERVERDVMTAAWAAVASEIARVRQNPQLEREVLLLLVKNFPAARTVYQRDKALDIDKLLAEAARNPPLSEHS